MATEYIAAVAVVVVSILKVFGILVPQDAITGIITGVLAIYLAYKQHAQGNITVLGLKK